MTLWPVFYISLLVNGVIGGDVHETVSARAGYAAQHGSKGGKITCAIFDAIDPRVWMRQTHCEEAIHQDLLRRGVPVTPIHPVHY
jgi:hypothetical protein